MRAIKACSGHFYSGPWLDGIMQRYGMKPQIEFYEVFAVTDNARGKVELFKETVGRQIALGASLVALHESASGTPRRFAAVRRFGRDRSEADMPRASGAGQSDENDPSATLAVHCGNGFDGGFSPYQSTRLSRYNAGP